MSDDFDVEAFDAELKAAGLPILGCSSNGDVQFARVPTKAERDMADAVKAAHERRSVRVRFTAEEAVAIRLSGAVLSAEEQAAVDVAISKRANDALSRARNTEVR